MLTVARTVKPEEYNAKRNEILDAAQRLIYSKGYERMTLQNILSELSMSSGAFYHYFGSKPAVLEALIERMQQEAEVMLLPIVYDPDLSAVEKLQRFMAALEQASTARKAFVADLVRVWFADDNAIVREKVYEAMRQRRAPLLTEIIQQGIEEGIFTTTYPKQVGEVILFLARGIGSTAARLMLSWEGAQDDQHVIDELVETYAAYSDVLERVLGAPAGSLPRPNAEAVKTLVSTLRNG